MEQSVVALLHVDYYLGSYMSPSDVGSLRNRLPELRYVENQSPALKAHMEVTVGAIYHYYHMTK